MFQPTAILLSPYADKLLLGPDLNLSWLTEATLAPLYFGIDKVFNTLTNEVFFDSDGVAYKTQYPDGVSEVQFRTETCILLTLLLESAKRFKQRGTFIPRDSVEEDEYYIVASKSPTSFFWWYINNKPTRQKCMKILETVEHSKGTDLSEVEAEVHAKLLTLSDPNFYNRLLAYWGAVLYQEEIPTLTHETWEVIQQELALFSLDFAPPISLYDKYIESAPRPRDSLSIDREIEYFLHCVTYGKEVV